MADPEALDVAKSIRPALCLSVDPMAKTSSVPVYCELAARPDHKPEYPNQVSAFPSVARARARNWIRRHATGAIIHVEKGQFARK